MFAYMNGWLIFVVDEGKYTMTMDPMGKKDQKYIGATEGSGIFLLLGAFGSANDEQKHCCRHVVVGSTGPQDGGGPHSASWEAGRFNYTGLVFQKVPKQYT